MTQPLRIAYIENIRLPTEKAHGYQIMKTCEALAKSGVDVSLAVTDRETTTAEQDPFAYYGIQTAFPVRRLRVRDMLTHAPRWLWSIGFRINRWSFGRQVAAYVASLPASAVVYTRDPYIAAIARREHRDVAIELHVLPRASQIKRLSQARGFLSVTSWMTKQVQAILPQMRAVTLPDSVDIDVFDPRMSREQARAVLSIPQDRRVIVYGGKFTTMEQAKGLGMLDNAAAEIAETQNNVALYLVGGSASEFERAEHRPPSAATTCVPQVNRKTLALYYRAADVLAMPFPNTHHYAYEMSPLKMFEYMASKTPIVTSDLPSVRDVLDEQTSRLCAADDQEALTRALRDVLAMPQEQRDRMGAAAYQRVVDRYTWEKRAQEIIDFLRNV